SPGGRWLAVLLTDLQRNKSGRSVLTPDSLLTTSRLEVVDGEGERRRPLPLPPGDVMLCDWRGSGERRGFLAPRAGRGENPGQQPHGPRTPGATGMTDLANATTSDVQAPAPVPRRRWLRPSVRALMALVLVLGGALGWVVHRANVQRDAVR